MTHPRLIGVLDIAGGLAVHAAGGDRATYRPIGEVFGGSSDPVDVGRRLIDAGAEELYIADLDALSRTTKRPYRLDGLATLGVPMIADQNVLRSPARIMPTSELRLITSMEMVPPWHDSYAGRGYLFGLDLRGGRPMVEGWDAEPIDIAAWAVEAGYPAIVLVDVAAVGTGQATTLALCEAIADRFEVELISGGGVASQDDVRRFADAGCDGVLVGTALHRGARLVGERSA